MPKRAMIRRVVVALTAVVSLVALGAAAPSGVSSPETLSPPLSASEVAPDGQSDPAADPASKEGCDAVADWATLKSCLESANDNRLVTLAA